MGLRVLAARFRERVVVVVERGRPGMHDELTGAQRAEKRLEHAEGKTDAVRKAAAAGGAAHLEMLENQRFDEWLRESRLFQGAGLGGPEILLGQNCCQNRGVQV